MKKRYLTATESEIRYSERDDAIRALEEKRLDLTREAEEIMRQYAKITGNPSFSHRSRPVGTAPNDYGFLDRPKR